MFETYLRDEHSENHADGVLDDDMPDHYEIWLAGLDGNDLIEYANKAMAELNFDAYRRGIEGRVIQQNN